VYYNKLDSSTQQLFQNRVKIFIERKSITGRQNFTVTSEVKLLLASSAVQLTLGLETWDLDYFSQILIYPSEYKNPQTGMLHKGETNMGGFMCFSWQDFIKGNLTPDDKINLGLHEFAHALRFSGISGNATDYFFENYFKRWLACAAREFTKMRKGHNSILRKYGAVNINEFFSVVIETFFEKPLEFKNHLPELFLHTSILLNQTFLSNGAIVLNCRESLMNENKGVGMLNVENVFSFVLPPSGSFYATIIFAFFGLFTFVIGGYKYPPAYILIALAGLCWLNLEIKYVRVYLKGTYVTIEKGFFLRNRFDSKKLPLSQLISFYTNYSDGTPGAVDASSVTYYYKGNFYEDDLYFKFSKSEFDRFCRQLIDNYVHVQIVE
jgi:Mlc titration factor MtfA (ptsG expression regulator)